MAHYRLSQLTRQIFIFYLFVIAEDASASAFQHPHRVRRSTVQKSGLRKIAPPGNNIVVFDSFLTKLEAYKSWKNSCNKIGIAIWLSSIITLSPFTLDQNICLDSVFTTATNNNQCQLTRIKRATAWALTEEQLLVDNVWREVNRQYVDQTFNNLGEEGWRKERLQAVKKVENVGPDEQEFVYSVIRKMLSVLGDPYTRFLTPEQFESLTSYARGGNQPTAGIGVQLVGDPATGKIIVLNVVPNSPAAKSGITPGDVILKVDNQEMSGATPEVVAAKCRGETGTEVTLAIQHGTNGDKSSGGAVANVFIKRSPIATEQVTASTFTSDSGKKIGVIKISSFSLETEKLVMEALGNLRKTMGLSSLIIDLRGNVGGYMPAGVNVAKLFLPAQARVVSEVDKTGRSTIYINDGIGSDTQVPLYLLVDKKTASAAEILAAALQDNHRATVVGSQTFGKG